MDKTRKEMADWSQSVTVKREQLKNRRNMIPPQTNMQSFMQNMEWDGEFGKELQSVLDDYTKSHDLDTALERHKPNKYELMKQRKKMASMRREIANQIKEFKRIKKIKSKSFRKRMRARKAKISPSLQELQEIDPKLYEREVRKLQKMRAEERLTLKHKNSDKWAMNIIRRGKNGKIDTNSRRALMEQLERGKELKRRIQGLDSDESMDENNDDANVNNNEDDDMKTTNNKKKEKVFETELESEVKRKSEHAQNVKDKGIWNMKFMKEAEDKRRADIRSLTRSAAKAHSFAELDDLENSVNRIEKSAYSVHSMIDAQDDPIAHRKYQNWLKQRDKNKNIQMNKAQTILGKRKFGFTNLSDDVSQTGVNAKSQKHKILDDGNAATKMMIDGTQMIEESAFGQGTKSAMNVSVEDEKTELVTEDTLKNKVMTQDVFEMIEFPKHNDGKMSISEINKNASKHVNAGEFRKYGVGKYDKLRNDQQIKCQRVYVDKSDKNRTSKQSSQSEEGSDEWKVLLDANESVHSVHFGTFSAKKSKKKAPKKKKKKKQTKVKPRRVDTCEVREDLNGFLNDSSSSENEAIDEEEEEEEEEEEKEQQQQVVEVQSILKRSKYRSVATTDKHIQWTDNVYSDGNPNTKFHSPPKTKPMPIKAQSSNNNPWLDGLHKNKTSSSSSKTTTQSQQSETTQFDRNKLLIPTKMVQRPDFNLLDTNDPKQIEVIYQSLNDDSGQKKFAQFSAQSTAENEFKKLKESVIEDAMPNAPEDALKGWDHWTGHGIEDDAALRDAEYLEAKALHQKKRKHLMEQRSDGQLANVILSDQISKASSKYVIKWQPDWVNIGMYRTKMNATMGREWNLSTEFFDAIRPQHDIPSGYILEPTKKLDANNEANQYKTSFGKKTKNKSKQKLYSVYKGDFVNERKHKNIDERPQRDSV